MLSLVYVKFLTWKHFDCLSLVPGYERKFFNVFQQITFHFSNFVVLQHLLSMSMDIFAKWFLFNFVLNRERVNIMYLLTHTQTWFKRSLTMVTTKRLTSRLDHCCFVTCSQSVAFEHEPLHCAEKVQFFFSPGCMVNT